MGQRHQIFIRIENPVKTAWREETKKELRKVFGNAKYSIIALHHQWLYGMSAIGMISHIFNITDKENMSSSNPFNIVYYGYNTSNGVKDFVDKLMLMLQAQTNPKFPRGVGIERMHFLNEEDFEITKDFTLGDNNDGITIIDTITRKYCLMNIYEQSTIEDDYNDVSVLPTLKPVSAIEYINAYYPNFNEDEQVKEDANNVLNMVKDYEVLTVKEVTKISKATMVNRVEETV